MWEINKEWMNVNEYTDYDHYNIKNKTTQQNSIS